MGQKDGSASEGACCQDYFNSRKNQKKRTDMKEWRGITGVQGSVKIGVNIIKMHCMHMKISKKKLK